MRIETNQNFLESRTYDEISVGDSTSLTRTLRAEDIQLFAIMSGDISPAIVDREFANSGMFKYIPEILFTNHQLVFSFPALFFGVKYFEGKTNIIGYFI